MLDIEKHMLKKKKKHALCTIQQGVFIVWCFMQPKSVGSWLVGRTLHELWKDGSWGENSESSLWPPKRDGLLDEIVYSSYFIYWFLLFVCFFWRSGWLIYWSLLFFLMNMFERFVWKTCKRSQTLGNDITNHSILEKQRNRESYSSHTSMLYAFSVWLHRCYQRSNYCFLWNNRVMSFIEQYPIAMPTKR